MSFEMYIVFHDPCKQTTYNILENQNELRRVLILNLKDSETNRKINDFKKLILFFVKNLLMREIPKQKLVLLENSTQTSK